MHLNEKIKTLIDRTGLGLGEFHRKILEINDNKDTTITYMTLYRTVHGLAHIRESTLFQIAAALGMQPIDIKKGTEQQEKYVRFDYNKGAYIEYPDYELPFMAGTLYLLPKARTCLEQSPVNKGPFVKYITGRKGTVTCVIDPEGNIEKVDIRKNDNYSLDSTRPHYFENNTNLKVICHITQYPKYL